MSRSLLARPVRRLLVLVLIQMVAAAGPASPTYAAAINVTTLADELTTNGQCSLREAIRNSNAAARPHPDCAAGTGNDTISLPSGGIFLAIPGQDEDVAA